MSAGASRRSGGGRGSSGAAVADVASGVTRGTVVAAATAVKPARGFAAGAPGGKLVGTMGDVEAHKRDIVFEASLRGRRLRFHSTWGLFSPRRIDDGTAMLIERIEMDPSDRALDLGCGYGPVGLALATEARARRVHMVDKDFVALQYARKNAEVNGIANVKIYPSNAFSAVPEEPFDVIAANLPANVGSELLTIILTDAKARLRPAGRLYVVTVAGLRKFIRRNFEEAFGNYAKLKQGKTYTVATAVRE